MNAAQAIRDAAAKSAALHAYALAHDHFAEQEQMYVFQGREIEATGCHEFALTALRGYVAEKDNRDVTERPCSVCGTMPCSVYAVAR